MLIAGVIGNNSLFPSLAHFQDKNREKKGFCNVNGEVSVSYLSIECVRRKFLYK